MENNAFYFTVEGGVALSLFYTHKWHPVIGGVEREITPVRYSNIHEKNIMDIWRSPGYTRFRFNVKYHQLPSCLDCPLVEGCALTRSNEVDCWGNKPTCSFCPYLEEYPSTPSKLTALIRVLNTAEEFYPTVVRRREVSCTII